jgi:hypothetical protein
LSTARQFQRHFVDKRDKLTPRNLDERVRPVNHIFKAVYGREMMFGAPS